MSAAQVCHPSLHSDLSYGTRSLFQSNSLGYIRVVCVEPSLLLFYTVDLTGHFNNGV